jgi:hypothetical protein
MSAGESLFFDYELGPATTVAVAVASARTAAGLSPGLYTLFNVQDCYVKKTTSVGTAASTDFFVRGNSAPRDHMVRITTEDVAAGLNYIAAIRATADGTLRIQRVNR